MTYIPREFINELLIRTDIIELIDKRVELRKKGNNYVACCPFHNEKTPSFTVSANKQFYHCFGCGKSGNALGFLMDYDHYTFPEAVEYLANQLGMPVPQDNKTIVQRSSYQAIYDVMAKAAYYYQRQLREHPAAINYLKSRGLSGQIAKEFGIGYAPEHWDNLVKNLATSNDNTMQLLNGGLIIKKSEGNYYDRFRDRIMFPIRDKRGRVVGFGGRIISHGEPKYLNSPETTIFHKGSELYGLYEVCQFSRQLIRIIVVEGYMDVVALAQHGIRDVVATLGTATTPEHIQRLFRLTEKVIFCFDGDRAGRAAAWRALDVSLPLLQDGWQVQFLFLPDGEDPDSFIRKQGVEQFNHTIDQSLSLPDFLFQHLAEQVDLSQLEGKARLAKLAIPLLDKIPIGVFQHMLYERLAQIVRMDVITLKHLTGSSQAPSSKFETVEPKNSKLKRSLMRLAVALLVQNPGLANTVDAHELDKLILPGSDLLRELVSTLQKYLPQSTGLFLEHWRDREEYKLLAQLAMWELNMPEEGIEHEFVGIIQRLQQRNREKMIETLLQKANLDKLSAEERVLLQNLIAKDKA